MPLEQLSQYCPFKAIDGLVWGTPSGVEIVELPEIAKKSTFVTIAVQAMVGARTVVPVDTYRHTGDSRCSPGDANISSRGTALLIDQGQNVYAR